MTPAVGAKFMGTAVDAVESYLQTDLVVQEALARGFLSVRKAARWMIETQGWDVSEEAVVSALRRYKVEEPVDIETAVHILEGSTLTARTGLAVLSMPRTREHRRMAVHIAGALQPEQSLSFIPEQKRLTLVLDEAAADEALSVIGEDPRVRVERQVAQVRLRFPDAGPGASTALAVLVNTFGHRGVDLLGLYGMLPSCTLLMPHRQVALARRVADDLTTKTRAMADAPPAHASQRT